MKREPFEGENSILRPLHPGDADDLLAILNGPSMLGRRGLPSSVLDIAPLSRSQIEAALEAWGKETKAMALAVQSRTTGALIGHAVCSWHWDPHCPWVDVVIAPEYQRRGLGSEALSGLLAYLFERTPAHTVHGGMVSWNDAALSFASANGFSECGRIPRAGLRDGVYYEEVLVDLLKDEWMKRAGERHGA